MFYDVILVYSVCSIVLRVRNKGDGDDDDDSFRKHHKTLSCHLFGVHVVGLLVHILTLLFCFSLVKRWKVWCSGSSFGVVSRIV